ncbi:chromatin assembly factor 1 subunit A-domain-containing protein [Mucor lusitanicus]|uniref:Chromatin assembly factor 1 subunit A-domain-containing protein n=1 Tax=Mucor circinelloides f. lusitanicus TaxID=29924 RepID=A0A8H4BMK8_MUCCL|nr:chromatin assembly factor 1 subunit A-domain-containing protein [Mucor lusitanicus]
MADTLLSPFKQRDYVTLAPLTRQPRKRLCSSFDTLFYVGLNDTFDLRQRFLEELPRKAKAKRGMTRQMMDLQKAWLDSTKTGATTTRQLPGLKMKLLQFHEDVRPAYYGTWTKEESVVTGRTPFAKHEALDYEYDSEAEWDHDVDGDDIYTLDPDEDEDVVFPDDDEEMANFSVTNYQHNELDDENKWVVPEGYLSDDEGIHVVGYSQKHKHGIVSRPAKWPIAGNKHFPMKPLIFGPSLETTNEPENHPLSDFKMHLLIQTDKHEGYSPFSLIDNETPNAPSTICYSPDKSASPLYRREVDKMRQENRQELVNVIVNNTSKTMMGLVTLLKAKSGFEEYTIAQLQAMIHDLAIQEVRGSSKEYNWYLRS